MSMVKGHEKNAIIIGSLLTVWLLLPSTPSTEAAEAIGRFTYVEGKADLLKEGQLPAVSVKVGDSVFVKDVVRTKSDAKAEITFADKNILRIGQRSRIDISEYVSTEGKGSAVIKLPRGKVQAIIPPEETVRWISVSPEGSRFEIHTPNAVAGVRGTDFFIWYEWNLTQILVNDGMVCGYNSARIERVVCVPAGLYSSILRDIGPTSPRPVTNMDLKRYEQRDAKIKFTSPSKEGAHPSRTATGALGGSAFSMPDQISIVPITEIIPGLLPPPPHVSPPR